MNSRPFHSSAGDAHIDHEEVADSAAHPHDRAGARSWRIGQRWRKAELITDATRSPAENRRHREKVYMILQGVRIPLLLLSAVVFFFWQNWLLSIVLFAVSIPLPWFAVVIANEKGEARDKRTQRVYKPAVTRQITEVEAKRAAQQQLPTSDLSPQDPLTIDHDD